jgi:hypothetical protein
VCHSPCKAVWVFSEEGFVEQLEDVEDLLEEEGDVAPAEAAAVAKPAAAQSVSPEFKAGAEAFALQCAQPSMRGGVLSEPRGLRRPSDALVGSSSSASLATSGLT